MGWPKDGILGLGSFKVTGGVLAYYLLSLCLQAILPGEEVEGVRLRSGGRLRYKFNGMTRLRIDRRQSTEVFRSVQLRGCRYGCRFGRDDAPRIRLPSVDLHLG